MTRTLSAFALTLFVAGCITTDSDLRWLSAQSEEVHVEGAPYFVRWIKVGDREIDFKTNRNQTFIFSPDVVQEQRRSVEASMVIARRECRTEAVQAENVIKVTDQMFAGRIRCS